MKLSEVAVGWLMKRLGFTPRRLLYRARQQNPELVQSWQVTEHPKLAKRAKKEGALIFFADEAGRRWGSRPGVDESLRWAESYAHLVGGGAAVAPNSVGLRGRPGI